MDINYQRMWVRSVGRIAELENRGDRLARLLAEVCDIIKRDHAEALEHLSPETAVALVKVLNRVPPGDWNP